MSLQSDSEDEDRGLGLSQFRLDQLKDRPPIMELDALHDALEDISWTDQQDWIETQTVTAPEASTLSNVDDDVQRELSFYNQVRALHCTEWCMLRWISPV